MIDYLFYSLYIFLFLLAIFYDLRLRHSRTFTIQVSNFTGFRKGDILQGYGDGNNAKVKRVKKMEDYTVLTVKPTKNEIKKTL